MNNHRKTAIIIGAGPAGLTAAYEMASRTDYKVIVLEETDLVGGISRTVNYKGNRMDIGGHRFFSKSDRVMNWWLNFLPIQQISDLDKLTLSYHQKTTSFAKPGVGPDPDVEDKVMLVRKRLSRIFFLKKFFNYPIRFNWNTLRFLGLFRIIRIAVSYFYARVFKIRHEASLEDFFINRFGKVLYKTFFKDYTEKVWGVSCDQIKPEWGAQRVKGLSVSKALWHALRSIVPKDTGIRQKHVETSLIDRFLYPKFGPGQLWEAVKENIESQGVEILMNHRVDSIDRNSLHITNIGVTKMATGETISIEGDVFFSTMPVKNLIGSLHPPPPKSVLKVSDGLIYRDFIAVGVLLNKMQTGSDNSNPSDCVPDNWIYIQENYVKVGRIQVFNNWSPYMVSDPTKVWLGMEYFCNEGDELWSLPDNKLLALAVDELVKIGLAVKDDFLDGVVVRMPKTYPAYFGAYENFDVIRSFTDKIDNLFLIGRNGMHKYNNQDHSMLTAMTAVDNLIGGISSRESLWAVNTEDDYHEEH
ncbi:MAG: NAD(P)/FAD-dependent oxidoreductase [Bacteroidales bacterium]|nr:NAD(P)/FAD-dependent oxidoreductase [Bacteroidales bacterium]